MSLRDVLLPVLWTVRSIPGTFGLRPHTVEVAISSWSGANTGDGVVAQSWTFVTEANSQPPKVRWPNEEEIALQGMPSGSAVIGPITPSFTGGGTLLARLDGDAVTVAETLDFRITGPRHPNGAIYRLHKSVRDRALHYTLQVSPVSL